MTLVPNFVKSFFDIKRLGTTQMLYDRLHAWLLTQSRLITLLPSLTARRRVRPQILDAASVKAYLKFNFG